MQYKTQYRVFFSMVQKMQGSMILNEKGDKGEGECLSFDSYDKGKVSVSVSILTIRVIRIETGTLTFAFITLSFKSSHPLHFLYC